MIGMGLSKPINLTGQTAIVTGAARGIGQATCLALAREGANIAAFDIVEPIETVSKVKRLGRNAISIVGSVTNPNDVKSMVDTVIEKFSRTHILVNNAGICTWTPFLDTTLEEWNKIISVNLTGAFLCTQAVFKHMMKNRYGKIVFIGSIAGEAGSIRSNPAYSASKGGIHALTKTIAKIGAPYNIYANAVAPNVVRTKMTEGLEFPKTIFPLGREAEPEDIAEAVVFLASPASNYITGEVLFVDGGFLIR